MSEEMKEDGESYLDQLLDSIAPVSNDAEELQSNMTETNPEPVAMPEESMQSEESLMAEEPAQSEEIQMPEESAQSEESLMPELELPELDFSEPDLPEVQEEDVEEPLEEVIPEVQEVAEMPTEEPQEETPEEEEDEFGEGEDISELLDLLSEHYDEEEEKKESMAESAMGMDDIFQDALSAVDYMQDEDADGTMPIPEEPVADEPAIEEPVAEIPEAEDIVALDDMDPEEAIAPDELEVPDDLFGLGGESGVETPMDAMSSDLMDSLEVEEEPEEEKPKKKSFRERFFSNIVDETTVEKEEKEREEEKQLEEKEKVDKAAKKELAAKEKEEKAAKKAEEQERKKVAAEAKKAEKEQKKAEKAEKKRLEREAAEKEVVGRINPVGAGIVIAFFVIIGVVVYFGTQLVSYKSYVKDAQVYMETGNYIKAYKAAAGVNLSEKDEKLFNKIEILASMDTQIQVCDSYLQMGYRLQALDALIKGIKDYDEKQGEIEKLEIGTQTTKLQEEISAKLLKEFQMTTAEARQILKSQTQEEYTKRLQAKTAQ